MQFAISVRIAKFASHKTLAKFRIAKIRNEFANQFRNAKISQCQIRNANFAMPISQCQIQFRNAKFNFAMPISNSQCQFQFRNANTLFICLNLSEISHCEIRKPLCQIRNPLPKFAISVGIAKFTLRNLQALSSSVINAEPPSIFGVLLFCPIT